ncbi:uncharacterized protein LOC117315062 isoform X1 [Pecten maximus]|uniref:uncharacterized protein LOC117315062 isoform X1 n=1 Tax=Pecten maximus TaxID=6579 RepID=UPI001458DA40|nr:uncharacterized protein LOC117315062 isoform X1 [Pecten maximus]
MVSCNVIAQVTDVLIDLSTYNTSEGTVVAIGCKRFGHRVIGPQNVTCLNTSQWSDTTQPKCAWTGELNTYEKLVIGVASSCIILLLICLVLIISLVIYRHSRRRHRDDKKKPMIPLHQPRKMKKTSGLKLFFFNLKNSPLCVEDDDVTTKNVELPPLPSDKDSDSDSGRFPPYAINHHVEHAYYPPPKDQRGSGPYKHRISQPDQRAVKSGYRNTEYENHNYNYQNERNGYIQNGAPPSDYSRSNYHNQAYDNNDHDHRYATEITTNPSNQDAYKWNGHIPRPKLGPEGREPF